MRRQVLSWVALLSVGVVWACAAAPARAGLLSKKYEFKNGVVLEMGTPAPDGLRLDSVHFLIPVGPDGMHDRTRGVAGADVAISNTGDKSVKVGLAIALFDAKGQLVGVARGGSKLSTLKAGRQKRYTLLFDNVNESAPNATVFQISVESKP